MSQRAERVLVLGYGNPGRLDDGLGPAFAARVESFGLDGVNADANYELTVEDAATLAAYDVVVFADAAVEGEAPFTFRPLRPALQMSFSTHSMDPASVLGLARELFGARLVGYVLAIRGYQFDDFGEGLSVRALANLEAAAGFFEVALRTGAFEDLASCLTQDTETVEKPGGRRPPLSPRAEEASGGKGAVEVTFCGEA